MLSVRYIREVLKQKMLLLWQQWLVSSPSGRSMNFEGKDSDIHVLQCLPGIDKWTKNFCKHRIECFHRFLVIVSTEHGQWQVSFTPEKSTDKPRFNSVYNGVDFTEVPKSPRNAWKAAHAQTVCTSAPSDFWSEASILESGSTTFPWTTLA